MRKIGLALILVAAACSQAGPANRPAPFDPVGMYDFVATLGTDERTGTLEIERTPQGLDAEAWVTGESQPALADSVVVDGSRVAIHALIGGGDVVLFDLTFAGDTFAGAIIVGMDSIAVRGERRAP